MSARTVAWLRRKWPRREAAVAGAYRRLFVDSPDGAVVLEDLGRFCHAATTTFAPGDPAYTAFNEGMRNAFLHVLAMAGASWRETREIIDAAQAAE